MFCPFGLKKGVIYPTYGLAEHTVYVCSNGNQRIYVDKVSLERDKLVRIMPQSMTEDLGNQEKKGNQNNDSSSAAVLLVGCGQPTSSKGLVLKVRI